MNFQKTSVMRCKTAKTSQSYIVASTMITKIAFETLNPEFALWLQTQRQTIYYKTLSMQNLKEQ